MGNTLPEEIKKTFAFKKRIQPFTFICLFIYFYLLYDAVFDLKKWLIENYRNWIFQFKKKKETITVI